MDVHEDVLDVFTYLLDTGTVKKRTLCLLQVFLEFRHYLHYKKQLFDFELSNFQDKDMS